MLVLTRKLQEKIQIGNDITITVLRVKGNTVRVGIEAPRDVRVVRAELPRFEDASTEANASSEQAAETVATEDGAIEFECDLDVTAVGAATEPPVSPPASKSPAVGRRFVIRQTVGRNGRPQITAVAAP